MVGNRSSHGVAAAVTLDGAGVPAPANCTPDGEKNEYKRFGIHKLLFFTVQDHFQTRKSENRGNYRH